jgi:hypothetical protein
MDELTDLKSQIFENRAENVMAKPRQNNQRPAIHAVEHPSVETISSSIPKGKIDDDITKVPIHIIHRKIGCEAMMAVVWIT